MELNPNTKPTILHLTTSLAPGGTERQLLLTIPRLHDFNHVIICLKKWGVIGDELKAIGFSVYFVSTPHFFSLRAATQCKKIIRDHKPKLMITYLPFADFFGRLWRYYWQIPKLICFLRSTMREWRYFPLVLINAASQSFVDRFFAVSDTVKRSYERWGLQKGKTDVIYNGVVFEKTSQPLSPNLLKVPNKNPLLGYVARLRKERGHEILFRAIAVLKAQEIPTQLWLVGDGPYQATLEHWARTLGIADRVTFLGYQKYTSPLLNLLTLYVHPSQYEGMSNALLEAMAAGCPIITTDIPENRELIQNGVHGILVPPKNPKALADAIQYLLNNREKARELGDNARKRIEQEFTIERTVAQLEKFLQSICK